MINGVHALSIWLTFALKGFQSPLLLMSDWPSYVLLQAELQCAHSATGTVVFLFCPWVPTLSEYHK